MSKLSQPRVGQLRILPKREIKVRDAHRSMGDIRVSMCQIWPVLYKLCPDFKPLEMQVVALVDDCWFQTNDQKV